MPYDQTNLTSDPSKTFTLEDFVKLGDSDNATYFNYSIIERQDNIIYTDHSLIDDYLVELSQLCQTVSLSEEEYKKYRYSPDLLAYDVYGSTQLDFIILKANDIVDPHEFTLRTLKLPIASLLNIILTDISQANRGYIEQNRLDNDIVI